MFFSSIEEINRSISKGMSNIYLKVTIEKNWRSQSFDFLSLKNLSPILWNLKGIMPFQSQKSPCFLLNRNVNFNKNKTESKIKNPILSFGEASLKSHLKARIKSQTVIERKECIFCNVYFVRRKFFQHLCLISTCLL